MRRSDAAHVTHDPRSELMPTEALPIPDVAMKTGMPFASLGVAFAMRVLMERFSEPGPVPPIFDERVYPLCGAPAPYGIVSCVWTERHAGLPVPHQSAVHDLVLLVVSRLQLTLKELVLAYAIVEQLVNNHPVCAQAQSMRPIFLIACVIATKVTNDLAYRVGTAYKRVHDVFTATSLPLMKVMEEQLLFMLNFDLPIGDIHQKCVPVARYHARVRTHDTCHNRRALLAAQMLTPSI